MALIVHHAINQFFSGTDFIIYTYYRPPCHNAHNCRIADWQNNYSLTHSFPMVGKGAHGEWALHIHVGITHVKRG